MKAATRAAAVGFVSLGCPKALVDSERIITELKLRGYEIAPEYRDADLVVVNTCGFIEPARLESLAVIREMGPMMAGIVLAGLDVIGDFLTEVNVTSPTCFQEIFDQTGFDVASMFIDALEQAARSV